MPRPSCHKCGGFLAPDLDGISCMNCGLLILRVEEPLMAMPPKDEAVKHGPSQQINELVRKYYDSIKTHRIAGASWMSISALIFVAERKRLHQKTIQKHYSRLSASQG